MNFSCLLCLSSVVAVVLAGVVRAESPLHVTSAFPGLTFADGEPVDVILSVEGPRRKASVDYTIEEIDGPWKLGGTLKFPAASSGESQTLRLTLAPPDHGLYRLRLRGAGGLKNVMVEKTLARIFAPDFPHEESPWGIFYVPPAWYDAGNPQGAAEEAASIRRLNASWVRLGFWEQSFGKVAVESVTGAAPRASMNPSVWKGYARELHAQGLHIMGVIDQVPRALSSQPANERPAGDGGPLYTKVKPADYALWDKFVEQVAREFRDEISVWEVWNEPDNQGVYFDGTLEEFVELAQHTSRALRRGNPNTKIAGPGFTSTRGGLFFAGGAIDRGLTKDFDIFTVHYTDHEAVYLDRWRELLATKRITLPIWNSEERSPIPLFNRERGVPHSFKFLHVSIGYDDYEPLVEKDYTLRPAGMAFNVGAHCLGDAVSRSRVAAPGGTLHLFQRGEEVIGVFQKEPLAAFLENEKPVPLRLRATPLDAGRLPIVTTVAGKNIPWPAAAGDDATITLTTNAPLFFINGCRVLEPLTAPVQPRDYVCAEAETGRFTTGWQRADRRDASGQQVLELWRDSGEGASGDSVDLDLAVPKDGSYEVIFAGSALAKLKPPRGLSPFWWAIDGEPRHLVDGPPPAVPGGEKIGEGLSSLGVVRLLAGRHIFRLGVAGPADASPKFQLTVDAIALRLTGSGLAHP